MEDRTEEAIRGDVDAASRRESDGDCSVNKSGPHASGGKTMQGLAGAQAAMAVLQSRSVLVTRAEKIERTISYV